jgi:hypothetical protein
MDSETNYIEINSREMVFMPSPSLSMIHSNSNGKQKLQWKRKTHEFGITLKQEKW